MIGSALKIMADADKLSVQQLQQAIKSGSVPAYIGVPMLQEKMKQQQEARMSQQAQQPKQPPVAERVLAEAEQGVDQLPSNMPQQYAHGGIVAFAEGGDTEDEGYKAYQEAKDMEEDVEIMNNMMKMIDVNRTPATGLSYGQVQGQAPKAARGQMTGDGIKGLPGSNHKYADLALKYAEKYNVDPRLALHVLNKETGGLENPEKVRSKAGAIGVMQTMPETAKMLGIKDPTDPEQSIEGGIRYLAQLGKQFKGDPRLTAAAYNAGPGNVRKYGDVPPFRETQNYVQGLKEGGITRLNGANDPSLVEDENQTRLDLINDWIAGKAKSIYNAPSKAVTGVKEYFTTPLNRGQGTLKGLTDSEIKQLEAEGRENATYNFPQSGLQPTGYKNGEEAVRAARKSGFFAPASPAVPETSESQSTATSPVVSTSTKETSTGENDRYDKWMQNLIDRQEKRAENEKSDLSMGLLAAGLGMIGSQSPYFGVGAGQGALGGLSFYQGLKKQRAAEEAADLGLALKAKYYQQADRIAQEQLGARKDIATETQQTRRLADLDTAINRIEQRYEQEAKQKMEAELNPTMKASVYEAVKRSMMQDPKYRSLIQSRFPDSYESMLLPTAPATGAAVPTGVKVTRTS